MSLTPTPPSSSPPWNSTTKLLVGLPIVAILVALVIQFRNIVGPIALAFVLAYLLYPLADRFSSSARVSWRAAVNIIYIILLIVLAALFTWSAVAIAQQLQSLINIVEQFLNNLPQIAANLSSQVFRIGIFELDLSQFDLQALSERLLSIIQPVIGRAGSLLGSFATSAASTIGWGLFVLVISYFLLADAGQTSGKLFQIDIPGYNADARRLGRELQNIWNAFLRGQLIIFGLVVIAYTILMMILGLRYVFGIALLAGMARFVPYLGPLIVWIITSLVAIFQAGNHFGLPPIQYAILVVVLALVIDQIFDNLIVPRFFGNTLGVHPAGVMVSAIVATKLIGLIGLVLAAPSLASVVLIGRYISRKLFDQEPFPPSDYQVKPIDLTWTRGMRRLRAWWQTMQNKSQ